MVTHVHFDVDTVTWRGPAVVEANTVVWLHQLIIPLPEQVQLYAPPKCKVNRAQSNACLGKGHATWVKAAYLLMNRYGLHLKGHVLAWTPAHPVQIKPDLLITVLIIIIIFSSNNVLSVLN